ncbi:hypothetical protein H0E87_031163, partial [Populus deltoides]
VGDEDMSWLKCSVIGAISEGVNFSSIRQSLIDDGIQFNGFCFLGATQVLIVFKSESDMMDAFYEEYQLWTTYFDELRPWLPTYCPIDRIRLLIATRLAPKIEKDLDLKLDDKVYHLHVEEIICEQPPDLENINFNLNSFRPWIEDVDDSEFLKQDVEVDIVAESVLESRPHDDTCEGELDVDNQEHSVEPAVGAENSQHEPEHTSVEHPIVTRSKYRKTKFVADIDFENYWGASCRDFPGDFRLIMKLAVMGKSFCIWNKTVFGNQNLKLVGVEQELRSLEKLGDNWPPFESEKERIKFISSERWDINVSEMCKVAWNKVIKLKDHGGLGLGSLQGKNLDLAP